MEQQNLPQTREIMKERKNEVIKKKRKFQMPLRYVVKETTSLTMEWHYLLNFMLLETLDGVGS